MKLYEYWCRDCGKHFYQETPFMMQCPVEGEWLELAATVDTVDHMDGFMGQKHYTNRRIIDKQPK